ncbi:MAG: putative ABC exporter domain-containing protein [Clostridium sp.]
MNDFKVLLYLDSLKLKNWFLDVFRNPLIFIKKISGLFIGLAFIIFAFVSSSFDKENTKLQLTTNISEVICGSVTVLLIISILFIISYYLTNYCPSNFTISDVYYLFATPLDSKIIYIYSLLKSAFKGILTSFIMLIYLIIFIYFKIDISLWKLIPLSLSSFFIYLFFMGLGYLLFALKVKYNAELIMKKISWFLKGIVLVFLISIFIYIYSVDFNFELAFTNINNSFLSELPLISSIISIIKILFVPQLAIPFGHLAFLSILTIFTVLIFLKLNVNYYEDAANKVEETTEMIKKLTSSRSTDWQKQQEEKTKKINLSAESKARNGVMSLYWKSSLNRKRQENKIIKFILYAINIAIGAAGAYFAFQGHDLEAAVTISVIILYISFIMSESKCELLRELKNVHIFLIPGRPIAKILATTLNELLILYTRSAIMLVPAIIFSSNYRLLNIGILILCLLILFLMKLKSLVSILLTPNDISNGFSFIQFIFNMGIVMIPAGICVGTFVATNNPYIAYAVLLLIISTLTGLLLATSELLFNKIEYK